MKQLCEKLEEAFHKDLIEMEGIDMLREFCSQVLVVCILFLIELEELKMMSKVLCFTNVGLFSFHSESVMLCHLWTVFILF